ncbi:MAG: hypothetical protein AAFR98_10560 [Pseudomonadota bacterium]
MSEAEKKIAKLARKLRRINPFAKNKLRELKASVPPKYESHDGFKRQIYPSYERYVEIQKEANHLKRDRQYVTEEHIQRLSHYINERLENVSFGLCHGTRQGREQKWFASFLNGAPNVIGTEISESADQYPNTIEWDFNQQNSDWIGLADFVYSNSWDHSFDPQQTFGLWIETLRPGGLLILDHTSDYDTSSVNLVDPVGIDRDKLIELLNQWFKNGRVVDLLDYSAQDPKYPASVIVYQSEKS